MEYSVRPARPEDKSTLLGLIQRFHGESLNEYDMTCNVGVAEMVIEKLSGTSLVLVHKDEVVGAIGGFITAHVVNKEPVYQEMMWYVAPEHRKHGEILLNALELMCRDRGIKQLIVGHMGNSRANVFERFYLARGYKLLECQYLKKLEG